MHPTRTPNQQPRSIHPHLHVGQLERDRLELGDLAAELLTLTRVVERVLVRRASHTEGHCTDDRPGPLKGHHRRLARRALAFPGFGDAPLEALAATENEIAAEADIVEDHLCGVRGADAVLLELLALRQPRGLRRDDKLGLAARPVFRTPARKDD